ncbi:general transcription factor 3C polypeptide 1 isoform X1 [Syngnathus scovelli]|uniref:general transcription factor 3C polypeptide 1 isoform X1 n=1 Tax=Syngnathus scovelli TaxID=161590 RepID=UPI0021103D68|nr:general transcription factor 3C polypeptide 1 isoform X1 [Syngnathus scovelli]
MDPLDMVEDEVALEGLDGITIPALWIRLGERKPEFPLQLDDGTKELVWRSLVANSDLTFYLLPAERNDVVLNDRFKMSHEENGVEDGQDVYPLCIIHNNKDGFQGSCATFHQRTDVTARLRSPSPIGLEEVLKRYGRKLVAVASQRRRFRALIGSESDPDIKLMDESYCMLERVGRARWQGELQSDLHKSSFKVDSRKLFYIRKPLVRHRLVCPQACTKRLKSGQWQSSILLLLNRFHVVRRSKYDMLMEYVSNLLQKMPQQLAALVTIREHLELPEVICKHVFRYMRDANLVEYCSLPLEDLDQERKPVRTRKGNKVKVRCLKLIKPYAGKAVSGADEWKADDDDDDDEGDKRRALPPVGRIMETDFLSQAYKLGVLAIVSSGTKGIPQSGIASRMNIGKLEARMVWRKLERDGVVKGFMVDEGRQRVTKFIGHRSVCGSDDLRLLSKEKQRKAKLFHSSAPPRSAAGKRRCKTPKKSRAAGERAEEEGRDAALDLPVGTEPTAKPAEKSERAVAEAARTPEVPDAEPVSASEEASVEEKEEEEGALPPRQEEEEEEEGTPSKDVELVDPSDQQLFAKRNRRSTETYRMLRRKNLIIEAVHKLKVIDGLYPLQKLINDEEKLQGLSSKCCKKTTARLVQTLCREGLLKTFTTTVIQDSISRKLDLYVHPSVQPDDELVRASIDQARFKITSSVLPAACRQVPGGKERPPKAQTQETSKSFRSFAEIKEEHSAGDKVFKPTLVRGLGKALGFQPKMHRLRVLHSFLWYVIYDHPLGPRPPWMAGPPGAPEVVVQEPPEKIDERLVTLKDLDAALSEDEAVTEIPSHASCEIKVYSEEDSWKRFVPPVRRHCDRGSGWVIVGDLLLCLPLSIYVQLIQINYQVDGLEEYLNDPVKQHHLIQQLPLAMRKKLFFRRKYVYVFFENLQRLVCMGLLHLAPVEKLKEKDMLFCYLKRHATIVDTMNAEPHYWLAKEPADKPFDRRRYTFSSGDDVDTYWFDLMSICLNTPLGCIRPKRRTADDEAAPSFVNDRTLFLGLASLLKGSNTVCDDGTTPGDGRGAAGLASEFFAHLKRNWLWTNSLLSCNRRRPAGSDNSKLRLMSLLSKEALRAALRAGASSPRFLTAKKSAVTQETVEVALEPSSRNREVVGGKGRKRKRPKKEVVKIPRKKKKEPKKRIPAHDEADHRALKKMTRRRVIWAVQEDSLLMLCAVASHLLNSKLRRTFVAHCLVRDLLQGEFQISEDKTSLAVGRRTRYILKNPQTFLNYRICLAEIYQDKDLLKQLQDNKPADPNNAEDCAKAFAQYVELLRQKFSSVLSADDARLPESKSQVFSLSKVCTIATDKQVPCRDTLTCTKDIQTLVLFNLIQSTLAMTNHQMKESRSFQTFHVYSRYPQELLCQVFVQCRKRHMVNRRRVCHTVGPKKNRALPILPMSFQLSQSYFRLFSWRFPHTLCSDSFRFLKTLADKGTGDDGPPVSFRLERENRTATNGEEEPEGEPLPGHEGSPTTRFSLDSPGGACVVSLALMTLGLLSVHVSVPNKMVVVDSDLVDNDFKSTASLEDEEDEDEEAGAVAREGKKKLRVSAYRASHTKYLLMKGFFVPGIVQLRNLNTSDNIVVESCVVRMRLRQTPLGALLSHRGGASLDLSRWGPSLLPSVLTRCVGEGAPAPARRADYSPEDWRARAQLSRRLDAAGEMGVDQADLLRELAHLPSLERYLEDLQEEGQAVRVGAYGFRWVLARHAAPWILTVQPRNWPHAQAAPGDDPFLRKRPGETEGEPPAKKMATDEERGQKKQEAKPPAQDSADEERGRGAEEEKKDEREAALPQQVDDLDGGGGESVSFACRPWRLVDGTLNRQVCKGMLEAVLFHIMSRPGITRQRLLSYYEAVLQPVVALELLQSLVELGCVVKRTLVKRGKPALFGPPPVTTERQECIFYEPTVDCVLRLARVLPDEHHWNYCKKQP